MYAFVLDGLQQATDSGPMLTLTWYAIFVADVLLVALLGYWLNDYYDRDVDAINRPERMLASSKGKLAWFWPTVLVLFLLGFIGAVRLSLIANALWLSAVYPVVMVALFFYAKYGKRTGWAGNVLVSLLIAILPLLTLLAEYHSLIAILSEYNHQGLMIIYVLFLFSLSLFTVNMARELVKDLEDEKGDVVANSTSVPIVHGRKKAIVLVQATLVAGVILNGWLLYAHAASALSYVVGICLIFSVILAVVLIRKSAHSHAYRYVSQLLKWVMLLGLIWLFLMV